MFLIMRGGPVWDSDNYLKSVTYRPTLSKFRGGPVKKTTLYVLQTNTNFTVYVSLVKLDLRKCARILRNYLEFKYYSDKLI